MYECWTFARGLKALETRVVFADPRVGLLAVLLVYIAAWQVLILWKFPKAFVGWSGPLRRSRPSSSGSGSPGCSG